MFKVIQDIYIEELVSKCTTCKKEQTCYLDLLPPTYCINCNNKLYPNPYNLYNNQLYRAIYHFSNEDKENIHEQ